MTESEEIALGERDERLTEDIAKAIRHHRQVAADARQEARDADARANRIEEAVRAGRWWDRRGGLRVSLQRRGVGSVRVPLCRPRPSSPRLGVSVRVNPKHVRGRTIVGIDWRPFAANRYNRKLTAYDPHILLDDGSILYFSVTETEGEYGVEIHRARAPKKTT